MLLYLKLKPISKCTFSIVYFEYIRNNYLKLPINFEMLDKIVITCSPWMGEQMKRMLKQRIQEIDLGIAKEQVIVKDSKFTNLIQRK